MKVRFAYARVAYIFSGDKHKWSIWRDAIFHTFITIYYEMECFSGDQPIECESHSYWSGDYVVELDEAKEFNSHWCW